MVNVSVDSERPRAHSPVVNSFFKVLSLPVLAIFPVIQAILTPTVGALLANLVS